MPRATGCIPKMRCHSPKPVFPLNGQCQFQSHKPPFFPRKTGHEPRKRLQYDMTLVKVCHHMSLSLSAPNSAVRLSLWPRERIDVIKSLMMKRPKSLFAWALLLASPALGFGQTYTRQASQFPMTSALVGDQTNPQISVRPGGGYIVWQDNISDGD